jgi:hypothetical protein
MTTKATWTVGDTDPDLAGTCLDDGTPVPLGAAATVAALIKRPGTTALVREVELGTDPGTWSTPWGDGDLSVAGAYDVAVLVEWGNGRKRTFGPARFTVAVRIAVPVVP